MQRNQEFHGVPVVPHKSWHLADCIVGVRQKMYAFDASSDRLAERLERQWHPMIRNQLHWLTGEVLFYAMGGAIVISTTFHLCASSVDRAVLEIAKGFRHVTFCKVIFVGTGIAAAAGYVGWKRAWEFIQATVWALACLAVINVWLGRPTLQEASRNRSEP